MKPDTDERFFSLLDEKGSASQALPALAEEMGESFNAQRWFRGRKKEDPDFARRLSLAVRGKIAGTGSSRIEALDGLSDWKTIWGARYIETRDPVAAAEGILSRSQIYKRLRPGDKSFDEELYQLKQAIDFERAHEAMQALTTARKAAEGEADWRTVTMAAKAEAQMLAPDVFGNRVNVSGRVDHTHHHILREERMKEIAEDQTSWVLENYASSDPKAIEGEILDG